MEQAVHITGPAPVTERAEIALGWLICQQVAGRTVDDAAARREGVLNELYSLVDEKLIERTSDGYFHVPDLERQWWRRQ